MTRNYESYKITIKTGNHHFPIRRETLKGADNLARKLNSKGEHGEVEGVWFDENGIHFDLLIKF